MSAPVTAKQQAVRAIEALPDDATFEDAIERLALLHRIEVGLEQTRRGETYTQEEVEAHFRARWGDQQG